VRGFLARFFCGEAAKKCAKMINLTKTVSAVALRAGVVLFFLIR
jgi:hypothetical protein